MSDPTLLSPGSRSAVTARLEADLLAMEKEVRRLHTNAKSREWKETAELLRVHATATANLRKKIFGQLGSSPDEFAVVEWKSVEDELPDADITVLISLSDGDVWTGFFNGDEWCYVSGDIVVSAPVVYWADFPAPPTDA